MTQHETALRNLLDAISECMVTDTLWKVKVEKMRLDADAQWDRWVAALKEARKAIGYDA